MPCLFFKILVCFQVIQKLQRKADRKVLEKSSVVISQQYPIWPVCKNLTLITKKTTSDTKVWVHMPLAKQLFSMQQGLCWPMPLPRHKTGEKSGCSPMELGCIGARSTMQDLELLQHLMILGRTQPCLLCMFTA